MTALPRLHMDGTPPVIQSELACEVCGHHVLEEDSPHEFAQNLTDRLICQVCGAHRLI